MAKKYYKGFSITEVLLFCAENVTLRQMIGYRAEGLRGEIIETRTLKESKKHIDMFLTWKRGQLRNQAHLFNSWLSETHPLKGAGSGKKKVTGKLFEKPIEFPARLLS